VAAARRGRRRELVAAAQRGRRRELVAAARSRPAGGSYVYLLARWLGRAMGTCELERGAGRRAGARRAERKGPARSSSDVLLLWSEGMRVRELPDRSPTRPPARRRGDERVRQLGGESTSSTSSDGE
jgi:hypothetical protein